MQYKHIKVNFRLFPQTSLRKIKEQNLIQLPEYFTVVLAEAIPQLGLFISLVGAVSSTALALIFPPIIEIVVCWQNAKLDRLTLIKDIFILMIGALGCVTGTYESLSEIIKAFSKGAWEWAYVCMCARMEVARVNVICEGNEIFGKECTVG